MSPNNTVPAYDVRRQWHHLWLVDPLDGKRAFADGRCDFSVNIALVEDGRPIFGVVHAPALRTTYYARNDRGAFKRTAGDKAVSLGPNQRGVRAGVDESKGQAPLIDAVRAENSSIALALCGLLEAPLESAHVCGPAMEWKTAAAHAVLKAAQLDIGDSESSVEPVYNKSVMMTAPMTVRE